MPWKKLLARVTGQIDEALRQKLEFVLEETVYAFMQAMGIINDHVEDCIVREKVERARQNFAKPEPLRQAQTKRGDVRNVRA